MGVCYYCFKNSGDMSILWKDCSKHNKKGKKGSVKKSGKGDQNGGTKGDVKAKNVRITCQDIPRLLSEATTVIDGISEDEDFSSLSFCDDHESTFKAKAALLVDSRAARTTPPTTSGLINVQALDNDIKLEYANGDKGSTIIEEGTLLLNGKELRALVSEDLSDGLLSTSQMDKELHAATIQTDSKSISLKEVRSKLHGHGTETIFIGSSENSAHRSGLILSRNTRDVIVRRSFSVWNEKP